MKTSGKEYFYSVSGLMVPKYMVNDRLQEYIDSFVDNVPKKTEELEKFANYDLPAETFFQEMEELYAMLCAIHAHWLEIEASRILRLTEVSEGDLCRMLVVPFIANVRTLAIDIQMAQNKGVGVQYHMRGEVERYKDVISSMKVIIALIKSANYKKAYDIAKSINELQDTNHIMPLISHITSKDGRSALGLAEDIRDIYKQKIEAINRSSKPAVMKKILVVDDMPEVLTVVSYMLREHYQVFAFKDGKEALRAIDLNHRPDAFLLDIDMPHMSGFTLAEKIRRRIKHRDTPILFLTANSTKENLIKSTQFDPKAFIVKPVNRDIIIAKLNSCLESFEDKLNF